MTWDVNTAPTDIVIVRHCGLRPVEPAEILASLEDIPPRIPRHPVLLDTARFKDAVDQGDWSGQLESMRQQVRAVHELADTCGNPEIHYFGIPEIPHAIAAGALLGDERRVRVHDFDRDASSWRWPEEGQTLAVTALGVPMGAPVTSRGSVVFTVEMSFRIADADVQAAVGNEHLAEVTIAPADGRAPTIGIVRSEADLQAVRMAFREALAATRALRPGVEAIYLFVAAPVSVCFAIGQELKPRNSPPVQTFRHRRREGQPHQQPALVLYESEEENLVTPLTATEALEVAHVRQSVLRDALSDVLRWAAADRENTVASQSWTTTLGLSDLIACSPFSQLPRLGHLAREEDFIAEDRVDEYRFDKERRMWLFSDRLLLTWRRCFDDEAELRRALRLFLVHEYVHDYQGITASTAVEVGKFGSVIEHVDYVADTYAVLHELAWGTALTDDTQRKAELPKILRTLLKAMWAFAPTAGTTTWEARRLRRLLNWYWRHVQVSRAESLRQALSTLSKVPRIEIGGLRLKMHGERRVMALLEGSAPGTHLEMALVLEDERLHRHGETAPASLRNLLAAFRATRQEEIAGFFRALFEEAAATGGALPRP